VTGEFKQFGERQVTLYLRVVNSRKEQA
jgi:hypothetical protein